MVASSTLSTVLLSNKYGFLPAAVPVATSAAVTAVLKPKATLLAPATVALLPKAILLSPLAFAPVPTAVALAPVAFD